MSNILLLELNEITWSLIDRFERQGRLPTFSWLRREGAWGAPESVDLPPNMDPWITWTTVYTGRPQQEHNVHFLQQPSNTIRARRIWEICDQHGLRVGVYGSLCSWPPQPVRGFYVPDTFSPDAATYPESLRPVQDLNLTYARSVRLPSGQDGLGFKLRLGAKLFAIGLRPATALQVASQLAREQWQSDRRWRRVALQPFVNLDVFSRLYQKHRPQFASFHTNHVAHYMHTYWKAMDPQAFPQETSPAEIRTYGAAVEHGYRTADLLLRRALRLLDGNTVLVVASSLGHKPFISPSRKGKAILQLRSLDRLLQILEMQDQARALSAMSDQFNIYFDTAAGTEFAADALRRAYFDHPDCPMFSVQVLGPSLTASLLQYDEVGSDSRCCFPHLPEDRRAFPYDALIYSPGLIKSGCHDSTGVLLLYGPGIRRGVRISECNNLDIAPTLLTLLGLPVPEEMKGRLLEEAFVPSEPHRLPGTIGSSA